MNNLIIFIIICIFLIIFITKVYILNDKKLEHLTPQSDEAIQNIASLYRKDNFAIGKLRLGDKWIMSGVGDPEANDDVFRVYKADGKLVKMKVGPFTSSEITDQTMGGPIKKYVDTKDTAVKTEVDQKLNTTTDNLKGFVTAEVKDVTGQIKIINDKMKEQDISSVYKNGQVTANKVLIGGKWLLIGGNDGVIRIHNIDGSGLAKMQLGDFTADQLFDKKMGTSVKQYIDTKHTAVGNDLTALKKTVNTDVNNKINTMSTTYNTKIADIYSKISGLPADVDNKLKTVDTKITTASGTLDGRITTIDTKVNAVTTKANDNASQLSGLNTKITNLTNQITGLNNRITGVANSAQGQLNALKKANILNNVQWDHKDWIRRIEQGKYFNSSMPDGTIIRFIAIHPHYMNTSHPTRNIVYLEAIKAGKQFLMWRVHHPDRHEMPNPWHNYTNDRNWRGNIF